MEEKIRNEEILEEVYKSKTSSESADKLVEKYLPFIKTQTAKFINRIPREGEDDELSIAMLAFHESVLNYERNRGAFLTFSALNIKNRLIDYYRKEKRHKNIISLDVSNSDNDTKALIDTIADEKNETEELELRSSVKDEILLFSKELLNFGLTLTDIADNCPKQERTLNACYKALSFAKENNEVMETFLRTKKIPMTLISKGSDISLKTLERHRKYLAALLLAYTNGFEIIRGHIKQINPKKGADEK